jgi:hypothetical protein
MSIIVKTVVAEAAKRFALPMLSKFIKNRFGDKAGAATDAVGDHLIEAIADRANVPVDELPDVDESVLKDAMIGVETYDLPDILELELQMQAEANSLMRSEMDKGPLWTWAWRPATMWFIIFLWAWAGVIVPLINGLTGKNVTTFTFSELLAFTSIYTALYMGGHTLKKILRK